MRNQRRNIKREINRGLKDQGIGSFEIGIIFLFVVAGIILMIVK